MFNEEENVHLVLGEICSVLGAANIGFHLAVVNNGSTDNTRQQIEAMANQHPQITLVHRDENIGYGGGILAGAAVVAQHNPSVIGWMWGDGQISPSILPTLYQACMNGADIAKINRTERHDGLQRKLISQTYAWTMYAMGTKTPDVNGCPKLFRMDAWNDLSLQATDWFLDAQAILRAEAQAMTIKNHSAIMKKRTFGKSKVNWKTVAEFCTNILGQKWKNKSS